MTKTIFAAFFLFFSCEIFAQDIPWKQGEKLSWDMFRAKNNLHSNDALAYTMTGWRYEVTKSNRPNGTVNVKVTVLFSPEKSWKKDGAVNDEVLKHEQNHFEISEIFARKLRKDIAEQIKTSADFDHKFVRIFRKRYREYQDFQDKYDGETNHGIIKEIQKKYNDLIAEMLTQNLNYTE